MKSRNRTVTQGTDRQVIEGIRKDLQGMPALHLGGKTFTPTTLERFIQARIDAASAIQRAKAAWLKAVADYDALDDDTNVVVRDLKRLVIGAFGEPSPELADFGFTARKPPVLTDEQKAAAVAKRAATRAAGGKQDSR